MSLNRSMIGLFIHDPQDVMHHKGHKYVASKDDIKYKSSHARSLKS